MPWNVSTTMSKRAEFCQTALQGSTGMSALCAAYGISRTTGYKWLKRYVEEGEPGLAERSRRPHLSPRQTGATLAEAVVALRMAHPAWGGRKIRYRLQQKGMTAVPSASTITEILRRHGLLDPEESLKHRAVQRFERAKPNQLWQMDFKGYFLLQDQTNCHALTILDDHSRYLVALQACADEKQQTVEAVLTAAFRSHGLPEQMLMDNGSPWGFGPSLALAGAVGRHTQLTVWLLRRGVYVTHGRPRHPQTQGKDERLHRTLNEELLKHVKLANLVESQYAFDGWRSQYNDERPHEALEMDVPTNRYTPSLRPFPEQLPPIVYAEGSKVRKVDASGKLSYANHPWTVGKAFRGESVAVVPAPIDGQFTIYYDVHPIHMIDLASVSKTP